MKTFTYERADSIADAIRAAGANPGAKFIAETGAIGRIFLRL